MKRDIYAKASFVTTSMDKAHFPTLKDDSGKVLPEIAVAGRSNVGKSSLLNDLFCSKNLVKTSSTPGKTQAVNFFIVGKRLGFVDLPGYGYAQVPMEVRKKWGPMVQSYLQNRDQLKLILFLFDIRRMPTEEDFQFLEWAVFYNKAVILVLTKIDKVNQSERTKQTKAILQAFNAQNLHYIHYSVPLKRGRHELVKMMNDALQNEMEATPDAADE